MTETVYDADGYPMRMTPEQAKWYRERMLEELEAARPKVKFDGMTLSFLIMDFGTPGPEPNLFNNK
jgi:hypothetical protein